MALRSPQDNRDYIFSGDGSITSKATGVINHLRKRKQAPFREPTPADIERMAAEDAKKSKVFVNLDESWH